MTDKIANTDMAAAWDGDEGRIWAREWERFDRAISGYQQALAAAAAVAAGEHVLDIGCGNGLSTRAAARAAAPSGSALGVDLSGPMLARAREVSAEEGVTNISFEQADVQVHDFAREHFDVAISRFGVMFFSDPVAAFANVASALRPGGRLAFVAWQAADKNEWISVTRTALAAGRELPAPPQGVPGPLSLADRDATTALLARAGFADIEAAGVEAPFYVGSDADDAVSFISGTMTAKMLLADLEPAATDAALAKLHAAFSEHQNPGGVELASAAWVFTARRA